MCYSPFPISQTLFPTNPNKFPLESWPLLSLTTTGKPLPSISTPPNQPTDWRAFYTRALNYLDVLDIKTEQTDDCCKGSKQLKLMFKGKDREALQTLIDNSTITEENMKTPHAALDAIRMSIKAKEHFWAHRGELLSDVRQQPNRGIHMLSQHICNLIVKCRFPHAQTQEILKTILLQHTVHCHEARDWIHQQDQSELMYQSLFSHCKLLKSRCKQYQKAGRGDEPTSCPSQQPLLQHPPFTLVP